MNKKVWTTMLILTIVFLALQYIAKLFFPEQFVMVIENTQLVNIGNYIDNHKWLSYLIGMIIGITSDYLFFGAVTRKLKLNWKLLIIIIIYNLVYNALYTFLPLEKVSEYQELFIISSTCYMIFVPCLFTKEILPLSITYSIVVMAQNLSLSIRNFAFLLTNVNSITMIVFTLEGYLWLLLCYTLFNYKKKKEE